MGKKDVNKKRKFTNDDVDNNESIYNDVELQAELAALVELRKEKIQKSSLLLDHNQNDNNTITKTISYNKEGLLKSIDDLDNHLPFSETLYICEYNCHVIDENDDIEREVSNFIINQENIIIQ